MVTVDLSDRADDRWPNPYAMFDLSVRDDGTPVVLYRDPSNDDLVLISCEDAQCTDRACTSLDSSLVSLGQPLGGSSGGMPTSFMVVDGHDRPTFHLEGHSGTEVLQCREARCGL